MNTANAMLVQMVTKVFERVSLERAAAAVAASTASTASVDAESAVPPTRAKEIDIDQLKVLSKDAPAWLDDSAKDAYMLLQVNNNVLTCLNYILVTK